MAGAPGVGWYSRLAGPPRCCGLMCPWRASCRPRCRPRCSTSWPCSPGCTRSCRSMAPRAPFARGMPRPRAAPAAPRARCPPPAPYGLLPATAPASGPAARRTVHTPWRRCVALPARTDTSCGRRPAPNSLVRVRTGTGQRRARAASAFIPLRGQVNVASRCCRYGTARHLQRLVDTVNSGPVHLTCTRWRASGRGFGAAHRPMSPSPTTTTSNAPSAGAYVRSGSGPTPDRWLPRRIRTHPHAPPDNNP